MSALHSGRLHKHFLVEVKACGKDQLVKLKTNILHSTSLYDEFFTRPTLLFVYDSHNQRVSLSHTMQSIREVIIDLDIPQSKFFDGPTYFGVPTDVFDWEEAPEDS